MLFLDDFACDGLGILNIKKHCLQEAYKEPLI